MQKYIAIVKKLWGGGKNKKKNNWKIKKDSDKIKEMRYDKNDRYDKRRRVEFPSLNSCYRKCSIRR